MPGFQPQLCSCSWWTLFCFSRMLLLFGSQKKIANFPKATLSVRHAAHTATRCPGCCAMACSLVLPRGCLWQVQGLAAAAPGPAQVSSATIPTAAGSWQISRWPWRKLLQLRKQPCTLPPSSSLWKVPALTWWPPQVTASGSYTAFKFLKLSWYCLFELTLIDFGSIVVIGIAVAKDID